MVDAYLDLLSALPQIFQSDPALMYRLWPRSAEVEGAFHHALHRPIYLELAKLPVFLLPNGQLSKMGAGVFRPDATSESLNMLFRQMFPMFMCPPALADEFRTAGVHDVSEVSADRVRQRIRKDVNIMQACYASFTRSSETQGEARAKFLSFVIDTLEFCLSDLSAHAPPGTPKSLRELQVIYVMCNIYLYIIYT